MTPLPENFLTTFIVPDNAVIDDQKLATEADMIIGNHAVIAREIKSGFLMVGEGVHVAGEINTDDDIRADVWCKFDQNVNVGGDAYIGEFTTINGKIVVEGDLDIGKEVKLNGGFLSKGWVVVRNPLPVMVFIFLYIRAMIGIGKSSEEIDKALNELFEDDEEIDFENMDENKMSEVLGRGRFFVIPLGSKISSESINVPEDFIVGNDCDIRTRVICKRFAGGKNLDLNGFIRAKGDMLIGEGSNVSGEINSTSGRIIIDKNVKISGKIAAKTVWIHETSFVEGKISSGNIRFIKGDGFDINDPENAEKATILSKGDSFDLINTNVIEKAEEEIDEDIDEEINIDEIDVGEEIEEDVDEKIEEGVDEETEEYLKADSAERDAEEKAAEAEMEEELVKGEQVEENEPAAPIESAEQIEPAVSKDQTGGGEAKKQGSTSKRAQKRRSKKASEKHENMPIVNVFTGESIENTESEKTETESESENEIKSEKTGAESEE
ncbi:hypothetical protein MmiEs2_14520 [Methanimicrococcus stummii]|uniref:Acyltransferase n=1 Tax=Methanimicrococcus stummii TaxID=3028294 RepID=A0AA96ZZF7_9EURY|nr:hypothetical protein [Methanimicrococcus sp. Es2]WNY29227.1 hypothetical protein MmiEs2_14520 [Methanimicrococcus sp. Es2]